MLVMLLIIDTDFETKIKQVIKYVFANLNNAELENVQEIIVQFIDYLCMKFGFDIDNKDQFETLLTQNNNQCIFSIIKLFFPYMDDTDDFALFKEIQELSDITTAKKPGNNFENEPWTNPYKFNTFQYSLASHLPDPRLGKSEDDDYDDYNQQTEFKSYDHFVEYRFSNANLYMMFCHLVETIELSRSKLHVNWLDILPLTMENYKTSRLYKHTFDIENDKLVVNDPILGKESMKYVRNFIGEEFECDKMVYYRGVSVHDMYNTFSVYLFDNIYKSGVKWLIYEQQKRVNERPLTYLEIVNDIFPISKLDIPYENLSEEKSTIISKWTELSTETSDLYIKFIRCIMLKFDLSYCTEDIASEYNYNNTEFYKQFDRKSNLHDEDVFLNKRLDTVSTDTISFEEKKREFFSKIPISVIYDFINDQINKFKNTWYGKKMIKSDGTVDANLFNIFGSEISSFQTSSNTFYVTYKNLYNYGKSIHINTINMSKLDNNQPQISSRNMDDNMWKNFFNMLNGDKRNWFNIGKVLDYTYVSISNSIKQQIQTYIDKTIRSNIKDIIFQVLISFGVLTELTPNPELTDQSLLGDTDNERKKEVKKRVKNKFHNTDLGNQYLDTEYYVTRRPFRELELYDSNMKSIKWFEHLTNGEPWYNYFAFSVISQIAFNLHFLNNRIIMVTGATGQGKSVAVPILFYYASIALDYNLTSKVLSTQALVAATLSNSKFMASNMGVPIELNGFQTFSPYFLYSTSSVKHRVNGSSTFIKEVTDRTLLEEIITNPLLKQKIGDSRYTSENLYDVVIIDEAHMHNVSMDLILTLLKTTAFLNNQLKVVITSATMEADEYIYRRYYKCIDDNYMFPISPYPSILEETPMDRNYIDRRFHISPPGQTSRYTVTDIFLADDTETYEEAEIKGIETVRRNIASSSGDWLFFTTTSPNTVKIAKALNEITPPHVIALPLYSGLRDLKREVEWFEFIKEIDKNLPNLIYSKNDICDVITLGEEGFNKIPPNTYSQVIVVATNVVEASITIGSLKYVVDTGYVNTVTYNFIEGKDVVSIEPISDASRMQRRGRVGRVSSGTVYYMYSSTSRSNIKPAYDLVTKDITFDIFNLLTDDGNELFYDIQYHPQNFKFNMTIGSAIEYIQHISKEPNKYVRRMYLRQYACPLIHMLDPELGYIQPMTDIRIKHNIPLSQSMPILYNTGYGRSDLIDKNGKFYIVHPGEVYIDRDIVTGRIITQGNRYKIEHVLKTANIFVKLFILKLIYYDKSLRETSIDDSTFDKHVFKYKYVILLNRLISKHGDELGTLSKTFGQEEILKVIKSIFIGNTLGCIDKVLKVISLLYSISSYKTFVRQDPTNPRFRLFDDFKNRWTKHDSELNVMLQIFSKFKVFYTKTEKIMERISEESIVSKYDIYNSLVSKHGLKLFTDKTIIDNSELSTTEVKTFTEARNQRHNTKQIHEKFKEFASEVVNENSGIDDLCETLFLSTKSIMNALGLYRKLKRFIKNENVIKYQNIFKDIYLINITSYDCLTMTFLENYTSNICKYDPKKKTFTNLISKVEYKLPRTMLTIPYESYYFYCYGNDTELIGVVPILKENILAVKDSLPGSKKLENPINITNKSKVLKMKESQEYDMNPSIKALLESYDP